MKHILIAAMLVAAAVMPSCKKKDKDTAGTGGNTTLVVAPQHHGKPIDSCTVYLKYNTMDAPGTGTSNYDISAKVMMVNGTPVATFPGMKKGQYYVFGFGYDPSINQNVIGGIPYKITADGTVNIDLPVSEQH